MPHAYSDDALTLARLLQEPVLRRARIHAGRAGAVTRLEWVAPWSVAVRQEDPLTGVLVHAHADELAAEEVTVDPGRGAAGRPRRGGAAGRRPRGRAPPTPSPPASCRWSRWPTSSRSPSSTGWSPT